MYGYTHWQYWNPAECPEWDSAIKNFFQLMLEEVGYIDTGSQSHPES